MASRRSWFGAGLDRLDRVGSGWLLAASVLVVLGLLAAGAAVHAVAAPSDPFEVVDVGDDFEGEGGTLAARAPEHPWTEVGGWTVEDGAVRVSGVVAGAPSIATVDLGSEDGLVAATGEDITDGWGLVFRYLDEQTYWAVVAVPSVGGYVVRKVVGGVPTVQRGVDLAGTGDGTELGVSMQGERFTITINGRVRLLVNDEEPTGGTRVGLIGDGARSSTARWTRFIATTAQPADA